MTGDQHPDDGDVWRVNPLFRRPDYLTSVDAVASGECPVPEGIEHCHGAEIRHADGWAECMNWDDAPCEAPGKLHVHAHDCYPGGDFSLFCERCK